MRPSAPLPCSSTSDRPGTLGMNDAHGLQAAVIVASNRAAAGVYDDTTGPLIAEALRGLGFAVADPVVRPDGEPVGTAIALAVHEGARVVLTTGGTGLTP